MLKPTMERGREVKLATVKIMVTVAANAAGCVAIAIKMVDQMDAAVSKLSQSDCELVRVVHDMDICRRTGSVAILPTAYCYRALAASIAMTGPTRATAPFCAKRPVPRWVLNNA